MYTHYPMNAQTPYMQQASIYGNPYQQRLEAITQQQAEHGLRYWLHKFHAEIERLKYPLK